MIGSRFRNSDMYAALYVARFTIARGALIGIVIVLSFVFAVAFAMCSTPQVPPLAPITRAATLTPTQTATVAPTSTNLPPTETATQIPTSTPTPTETNTPTLAPSLTISPSVTPIPVIAGGRPKVIPTTGAPSQNDGLFVLLIVGAVLVLIGGYLLAGKDNPTW